MSYTHKRTVEITTTIKKIATPFMTFKAFSQTRDDIKACALCDKKFEQKDDIHLGMPEKGLNILLCDDCKNEAIKHDVEVFCFKSKNNE